MWINEDLNEMWNQLYDYKEVVCFELRKLEGLILIVKINK